MPSSRDRIGEGRGDRIALRTADRTYSYGDVEGLAGGFAAALAGLGVHREDRVVLLLTDRAEYVGALFGALKLAAVVVMVNPELDAGRIAEILDLASPRRWSTRPGSARWSSTAVAASMSPPGLLPVPDDGLDLAADVPAAPTHRDDPALWLFSGGTTGVPKAVVQTHGSFLNTTFRYAHDDARLPGGRHHAVGPQADLRLRHRVEPLLPVLGGCLGGPVPGAAHRRGAGGTDRPRTAPPSSSPSPP